MVRLSATSDSQHIESNLLIRVEEVRKTFPSPQKDKVVGVGVSVPLSFSVERGEIFGIIGPDGAGKTTLIRLLISLYKPDRGTLSIDGLDTVQDYKRIRNILGYMPGTFSLYPDLTVEENLHFFSTLFDTTIEENFYLIEDIYKMLVPFKKRKARALSGGMKQKLALSCALIHKPLLLVLDEPTTGIDPISRVELWDMLSKLSKAGVTVVASTAYMDEAKRCDRIAFMTDGDFLTVDTPENIVAHFPHTLLCVKGDDRLALLEALRTHYACLNCYSFGDSIHCIVQNGTAPNTIEEYLRLQRLPTEVSEIAPSLEDAFIQLSS